MSALCDFSIPAKETRGVRTTQPHQLRTEQRRMTPWTGLNAREHCYGRTVKPYSDLAPCCLFAAQTIRRRQRNGTNSGRLPHGDLSLEVEQENRGLPKGVALLSLWTAVALGRVSQSRHLPAPAGSR